MQFLRVFVSLSFLVGTFQTQAQTFNVNKLTDDLSKKTEGIASDLAVSVVQDGQIVYEQYFSDANLEHQTKVNQNIRFEKQEKNGFVTSLNTADGGKISVSTTSGKYGDILLTKNNPEGNEEWYEIYGGSSYDRASSLIATKDGGYLIIGSTSSFGAGNYDVYIIKVDAKGKEEWSKTYGGELNEYGHTAEEQASAYLVKGTKQICGDKVDFTDCVTEVWTITIDKSGKRKFKQ